MTRDPFLRLALITAGSLYVLGLIVVGRWLGVYAAGALLAGGTALAVGLSVEHVPTVSVPERPDPRRFKTQADK